MGTECTANGSSDETASFSKDSIIQMGRNGKAFGKEDPPNRTVNLLIKELNVRV
jgi:hypothetical protein